MYYRKLIIFFNLFLSLNVCIAAQEKIEQWHRLWRNRLQVIAEALKIDLKLNNKRNG